MLGTLLWIFFNLPSRKASETDPDHEGCAAVKTLPHNFFDPKKYVGTEDVKQLCKELVKRQGYVVISFTALPPRYAEAPKVGMRTRNLFQFFVEDEYEAVENASADDWSMQTELIAHLRPAWKRLPTQRGMIYLKMKPV